MHSNRSLHCLHQINPEVTPLYVAVKMASTKGLYSVDIHMIPRLTSMLCVNVMQSSKMKVDFVYKIQATIFFSS